MHLRTRFERIGTVALGGAAAFLVPWIAHLDRTLPDRAAAEHWRLAWVGLDAAIAAGLSGTVATSLARDRRAAPVGAATAALMVADSWFDICTASSGSRWWAVASACCEVPLAVLCVVYATRCSRARADASAGEGPTDADRPALAFRAVRSGRHSDVGRSGVAVGSPRRAGSPWRL